MVGPKHNVGPKREQMAVYVVYHNLPLDLVLYPNAYPNKTWIGKGFVTTQHM